MFLFQTYHPSEKSAGPKTFQQELDDDHQPFPTLELVFNTIDVQVGFNIELKWDMEHLVSVFYIPVCFYQPHLTSLEDQGSVPCAPSYTLSSPVFKGVIHRVSRLGVKRVLLG